MFGLYRLWQDVADSASTVWTVRLSDNGGNSAQVTLDTFVSDEVIPMSDQLDDVIARAVAREAELQKELTDLKVFLSVYRRLTDQKFGPVTPHDHQNRDPENVHVFGGESGSPVLSGDAVGPVAILPNSSPRAEPPPKGMRQPEFVAFVRNLLIEQGRPMQAHEILSRFRDKGRHVGGSDETSNLKTKLWRAKTEIIAIPGSGYWPVEIPCDAVSYHPKSQEQSE